MRFDISFENPITQKFPDSVAKCLRHDAPFDVCGGCVHDHDLDVHDILEIEHPPYSEPGVRYDCSICGYRIY